VQIVEGDLRDPRVVALLDAHLARAHAESPPCSVHALDNSGLQSPGIDFWSMWDGDALVAVGALKRLSADHGEVKSMHTAERRRRTGAASAMLRHIIAAARRKGMARLSLETGASDYFRPAQALYARHGFTPCLPFADYVVDPHSVFMTLDLRSTATG
jgi:putative acetyltransferase